MSHSFYGASGLGDHGITGIEHFIKNHECNPICQSLALPSKETLTETLEAKKREKEELMERTDYRGWEAGDVVEGLYGEVALPSIVRPNDDGSLPERPSRTGTGQTHN